MEMKTVHGLLVFLDVGLDTTISSNMVPTSSQRVRVVLRRSHSRGLACRLRSGACGLRLVSEVMPEDNQRSSNTKTGVRSYHNPHHQGKGESTKHLAAHQEQNEHGEESQTAGQDRPRQCLIDGLVHDISERFTAQQAIVLTDAIENNDGVVHRISDQSEKRRYDRERNLKFQQ